MLFTSPNIHVHAAAENDDGLLPHADAEAGRMSSWPLGGILHKILERVDPHREENECIHGHTFTR